MTTTLSGAGYHENYDLYSPIAFVLKFYEEDSLMKVDAIPTKYGRFVNEFEILGKLGEGSFWEAFKVRQKFDGRLYAVKKSKE